MPSIRSVNEKLDGALRTLVGTGRIQDRLFSAYVRSLMHLRPDDFPPSPYEDQDPRNDLVGLKEAMISVEPVGDELPARAATRAMSDEEAEDWAKSVVSMCLSVHAGEILRGRALSVCSTAMNRIALHRALF